MRLERIKVLVEEAYGFPIAAKNRKRNVVYARKVFCKIGREFGYKWQDIADHVGYPKHDLAIYAFKTFHAIEEYDMKLYERIVETIECYILEQNKQSEIERYNKILKDTEASYLDIVIRSEGAINYQDIMTMPVDSIRLLIERMNKRVEEINNMRKGPVRT